MTVSMEQVPAPRQGKPHSPETRLKMRLAKLGKKHSEEHNRRTGEGLRRWSETAEPWQKRRGWWKYLSDQEAADLSVMRRAGLSRAEALRAIDRGDLAELALASIRRLDRLSEERS
ncbi:hypothetical protein CNY89_03160 [Amaricoccus sp. HAR-UPW-R2A-40]|nr:hypothetical protein CNY89_03160 [Amaricoccus sp. HAR-UPW-R2A-40]